MGRNLTSLPISASFQYLLQVSGSSNDVNDGVGNEIDTLNIDITGNANSATTTITATTASYVAGANVDGSVASATTAATAITANTASYVAGTNVVGAVTLANTANFATLATTAITANTASLVNTDDGGALSGVHYIPFVDVRDSDGQQLFTDAQLQYNPATDTIEANLQGTASLATTASFALNAAPINTGSFYTSSSISDATITFTQGDGSTEVVTVDNVATATSASHALVADTALDLASDANINILSITASNATFTSASIGYLQSITGSAKIIGDAFIILNNDTPTERYAGIKVQDSGSTDVTSSLIWDGQTNDWKYEFSSSAAHEGGVVLFGPEGSDIGSLPYPTANTLQKGTGGHHLEDSSITDDGTLVTINANVSASGYISASGFVGDLTGTATSASFASSGTGVFSGSFSGSFEGDASGLVGAGELKLEGTTYYATDQTLVGSYDTGSVIIGVGAFTSAPQSVVIGSGASTQQLGNIAIGASASAGDDADAIAIGKGAYAFGQDAYALGTLASASSDDTIALGDRAAATDTGSFALGKLAQASSSYSIALGYEARAWNDKSIALGYNARATGSYALDIKINDAPLMTATTASQDVTFAGGAHFTDKVTGDVSALSIASTTASMDCSAGNFFALTLAAGVNTHLDATNLQAGQTINLKVTNNAITAGTISFSPDFEFVDGAAFEVTAATSAVDVMTFISFDGASLQATGLKNFS